MKYLKLDRRCLWLLAALVAMPVMAQPDAPSRAEADANAKPEDEALEAITIIGGAVTDKRNPRWADGDADKPALPVVAEDAFLDQLTPDSPDSSPNH